MWLHAARYRRVMPSTVLRRCGVGRTDAGGIATEHGRGRKIKRNSTKMRAAMPVLAPSWHPTCVSLKTYGMFNVHRIGD
jgi:hypothetical protein